MCWQPSCLDRESWWFLRYRYPHLFILFLGFSRQECWSVLPFSSPVDHIFFELSFMTHPSQLILHASKFSSVQSLSHVRIFATPWTSAQQASLSITNSRSLPKLMSIELVMPSNHLIHCWSLVLLPPIPPSIRVFSNESALRIRWPKYWSFSFNTSPSNEDPGLISFRMDWLDLLAVEGTLKYLLLNSICLNKSNVPNEIKELSMT